jgi:1,2-phenylacetyl-CoA epoxidase PaaB subunit
MALALHAGDDERVAVYTTEEVWLRRETGAEVGCVGGLFGDCVAAAGSAVSWKQARQECYVDGRVDAGGSVTGVI